MIDITYEEKMELIVNTYRVLKDKELVKKLYADVNSPIKIGINNVKIRGIKVIKVINIDTGEEVNINFGEMIDNLKF